MVDPVGVVEARAIQEGSRVLQQRVTRTAAKRVGSPGEIPRALLLRAGTRYHLKHGEPRLGQAEQTVSTILSSLLPGVREVRAPLIGGYLWLCALWLAVGPSLPPKDDTTGVVQDVVELADWTSPAPVDTG